MKASPDFEEGADTAVNLGPARCRSRNPGQDFQESGFARTVASNETEDFALADVERDFFKSPKCFRLCPSKKAHGRAKRTCEDVAESMVALVLADAVTLGELFGVNDSRRHCFESELDAIGNGCLHAVEEEQPAEEDERDDEGGSEKKQVRSVPTTSDGPAEAVND